MIKEKVLKVLRSLPPEANIESESMQQHIADQIYDELFGSENDIHSDYHKYLFQTCNHYRLDPAQIINSRSQPGMDIKHCVRYILHKKGYTTKKIAEMENIHYSSVINSIRQVESDVGLTKEIMEVLQ